MYKERTEEFLKAWKNRKWKKLMSMLQITWNKTHSRKERKKIRSLFQEYGISEYTILSDKKIGPCMYDVQSRIVRKSGIRQEITIRLVCEIEPYKPSLDGTWGVNPISCLRIKNR